MLTEVLLVLSVAFVLTQVAIFTTTIYLHRCLTHRAVTFAAPVAATFRVLTWLTTGIRPRQWVAVHRKHHAHTDTDEDPHSPIVLGWWRVQLTNVTLYRRAAADPEVVTKYAKDLPAGRLDRWLLDHAVIGLGLLVVGLTLTLGPVAGLLAAGIHFVAYLALSGSVNGPGSSLREPDLRGNERHKPAVVDGAHCGRGLAQPSSCCAHLGAIRPEVERPGLRLVGDSCGPRRSFGRGPPRRRRCVGGAARPGVIIALVVQPRSAGSPPGTVPSKARPAGEDDRGS